VETIAKESSCKIWQAPTENALL